MTRPRLSQEVDSLILRVAAYFYPDADKMPKTWINDTIERVLKDWLNAHEWKEGKEK